MSSLHTWHAFVSHLLKEFLVFMDSAVLLVCDNIRPVEVKHLIF